MASREQIIVLTNLSTSTLTRLDEDLDHGEWYDDPLPPEADLSAFGATWVRFPPSRIDPHTVVAWGSRSSGFMTGTEGWVNYKVDKNGDDMKLRWDVPFAGVSEADADVQGFNGASTAFAVAHSFHGQQATEAF